MLDQWISSASGFLLVFAINDLETFQALEIKAKRIQKNEADKLPIILVGNKSDLKEIKYLCFGYICCPSLEI